MALPPQAQSHEETRLTVYPHIFTSDLQRDNKAPRLAMVVSQVGKRRRLFANLDEAPDAPRLKAPSMSNDFGYSDDHNCVPSHGMSSTIILTPPVTPPINHRILAPSKYSSRPFPIQDMEQSPCRSICYGFFSSLRSPKISPRFPSSLSRRSKEGPTRQTEELRAKHVRQDEAELQRILREAVAEGFVQLVASQC